MGQFIDDKNKQKPSECYNFKFANLDSTTLDFIKDEKIEKLAKYKKYMSDELLYKLRTNSDSLDVLERIGYPEEVIMNMLLRYDDYSGLDILSCIYALEAEENNMNSYLDQGQTKKKV